MRKFTCKISGNAKISPLGMYGSTRSKMSTHLWSRAKNIHNVALAHSSPNKIGPLLPKELQNSVSTDLLIVSYCAQMWEVVRSKRNAANEKCWTSRRGCWERPTEERFRLSSCVHADVYVYCLTKHSVTYYSFVVTDELGWRRDNTKR